jgi:selenocysteine-specific elongation factor
MERGTPEDALLVVLSRLEPCEAGQLSNHTDLGQDQAMTAATALVETGRAIVLGEGELGPNSLLYTADGLAALSARARETVAAFHQRHPLRRGIPKEELRSRLGLEARGRAFDAILTTWAKAGELREASGLVADPKHQPQPTNAQQAAAESFLQALRANPYAPTERLPDSELLAYLEEQGRIVRVEENIAFAREAYDEMTARIVEHLREKGTITLAQVRDMFGASRKYAKALLEHLDEQRITRRVGDERVLRRPDVSLQQ